MASLADEEGSGIRLWRLLTERSPGRFAFAARLALICALTAVVAEVYQTPEIALTIYIAFFLNKADRVSSMALTIALTIFATIVLSFLFLIASPVLANPSLRVGTMAGVSFCLLFLVSASKLKPVGSDVALVIAYALDVLGSAPIGELATRALLYAWLFVGIPAGASFLHLHSSEQNIRLQTTGGGGIGRYLTNTNHASIAVMGGFAGQNTNYKRSAMPVNTENLAAAILVSEVKLFRFNKTNLTVTSVLLPALSQPGRLEFSTNATYYIKIFSNLNWNISFYGNWDNHPPPSLQGRDYGTSSGLSWTFGMR
jgi:hypothetical protein